MRDNLLRLYITCFFVLSNVLMFAQNDEDDNGDLEGNDPPAVPINSKMILLIGIGIVYSFYVFRNQNKKI